jgi:flagellar hook-associated protein 2
LRSSVTPGITEDISKISGKVKALVDAMNGVLEFVNKQNKLDADSDTTRTLGGDTALFTIESRLRRLIFQQFHVDEDDEDAVMQLSDIGIRFEKTGLLTFNEDKFKKQITENFDYVSELFAGDGNFVPQIKYITDGFLLPDKGTVTTRERGIKDRIKQMDDQIAMKERALDKRQETLKRQFSQLEGLLQSMQGQQQYLQQAMGNPGPLPGIS